MNSERLPRILRNTIDLYELNQRLLGGETSLDWSDVRLADIDALQALFADVNLDRHADALNLQSAPNSAKPKPKRVYAGALLIAC